MAKKEYAIFREEKRTDLSQIRRSNKHNLRLQDTPNADPSKPPPVLLYGPADLSKAIKSVLPKKRRKNAVLAVEAIFSASPAFFARASEEERKQWTETTIEWMKQRCGDNLIQVVAHDDETTFHLHAYWVPLKDGKLNYRAICGSPSDLVQAQTGYAAAVAKYRLARGNPNSQRRHAHHSAAGLLLDVAQKAIRHANLALVRLAEHVNTIAGHNALKTVFEKLNPSSSDAQMPAERDPPSRQGEGGAAMQRTLKEGSAQPTLRAFH